MTRYRVVNYIEVEADSAEEARRNAAEASHYNIKGYYFWVYLRTFAQSLGIWRQVHNAEAIYFENKESGKGIEHANRTGFDRSSN